MISSIREERLTGQLLPPTYDTHQLHVRRANYQTYTWRHNNKAILNLLPPDQCGLDFDNGTLQLVEMTQ